MIATKEQLLYELWYRLRTSSLKWRTKDGNEILLANLSTEHLCNIIAMIESEEDNWVDYVSAIEGYEER